jgi:hypothetical protein
MNTVVGPLLVCLLSACTCGDPPVAKAPSSAEASTDPAAPGETSEPSVQPIDCNGPSPLVPRCPPHTSLDCAEMWAEVEAWRAACEPPPSPAPDAAGSQEPPP